MKGTVVIIVNPNGSDVASAVDCGGADAAGFSVESEQRRRARGRAVLQFARSHINHWMADALDPGDANNLWKIAERAGYKMIVLQIED